MGPETRRLEYDVNMTNSPEPAVDWPAWNFSEVAFSGRRLDRPGPEGGYFRPKRVTASDGRLVYWYLDPDEPLGVISDEPEDDLTPPAAPASSTDFVPAGGKQLEDLIDPRLRSDEAIVEYARRWGVLEICDHGLPRTHSAGLSMLCRPLRHDSMDNGGWEPLAAWRFFRSQALGLLAISDRLRRGERIEREAWRPLFDEDGPRLAHDRRVDYGDRVDPPQVSSPLDLRTGRIGPRPPPLSWVLPPDADVRPVWEYDLHVQRWAAGLVIQSWLEVGRPEMFASWTGRGASISTGARSLFGALAIKVALAASGSFSFSICHECRALFLPIRRAKRGQRSYCDECRKDGVPERDAARAYRERRGAKPRPDR